MNRHGFALRQAELQRQQVLEKARVERLSMLGQEREHLLAAAAKRVVGCSVVVEVVYVQAASAPEVRKAIDQALLVCIGGNRTTSL